MTSNRATLLLLLLGFCSLCAVATDDDDAEYDPELYANGTWSSNDTDYYDESAAKASEANEQWPDAAVTSRSWLLTSGKPQQPVVKCELPVAFECRCVYQPGLSGYKVSCELLTLNSVPTELISSLPARTVHL